MPGTINLSLSQRFDARGKPLAGGQLFFFAAGTDTPQNAYYDQALTLPYPNPITLDAAGNIPAFFLADGSIKIRLTDNKGVQQLFADNLLVIGPSSGGGGGGGGSVDPTTVLSTGDLKFKYGTGSLDGFVRLNARTIGSLSSGATERANADTQNLFVYLWNTDTTLAVSGGRGASGSADYLANKTIALPDWRGRVIGGLDDMGNTAAGRLTASYFGASATVLGAAGGAESQLLTKAHLPDQKYLLNGAAGSVTVVSDSGDIIGGVPTLQSLSIADSGFIVIAQGTATASQRVSRGSFTPSGDIGPLGFGQAHAITQPTALATFYCKL